MKKIFLLLSFIGIGIWGFAQTASTTTPATNITYESADVSGTVDTAGVNETDVSIYFAYRTSATGGPGGGAGTWNYSDAIAVSGSGTQTYNYSITGLDANKGYDYYIMLWNNNTDVSAADGDIESFTTNEAPTATAPTVDSKAQTTASITGGANAKGNGTYDAYIGYKTGINGYTYVAGSPSTVSGSSETSFTADLSGLDANTTYKVVSVLHDGSDFVATSSETSFTTDAVSTPTVETAATIDNITKTDADNTANKITNNGGADITDKGIVWSTSTSPTTADNKNSVGSGDGDFNGTLTSLSVGTKYYVRAYATNSEGTSYGAERNFITNSYQPTGLSATDVQATSYTANWSIQDGAQGYQIDVATDNGFTNIVKNASISGGSTKSYSVTGLTQDQDYFFRMRTTHDGGDDGADYVSDNSSTESLHTLVAEPTTQATNLTWDSLSNTSMRIYWDNGNGAGRIVVMKVNSGISDPSDGTTYTADNNFGSGSDIGGTGSYVVYDGKSKATSVDVTGLNTSDEYYIKVYEYNGSDTKINYNTTATGGDNYGKTTLPVSLLSFKALSKGDNVLISWETASELNNDYFIIERSLDGENFKAITKVEGAGNSNILLSYEFVDKQKLNGVVYYRLTQFDYDGKKTVFNVVSVNLDNKDKTIETVFVDNNLLSIDLNIDTKASVSLVDANGKVSQMAILPAEGKRNLKFDMNSLSRGVYFIVVDDGVKISSRKFVY